MRELFAVSLMCFLIMLLCVLTNSHPILCALAYFCGLLCAGLNCVKAMNR